MMLILIKSGTLSTTTTTTSTPNQYAGCHKWHTLEYPYLIATDALSQFGLDIGAIHRS